MQAIGRVFTVFSVFLFSPSVYATEAQFRKVTWNDFQNEVSQRQLKNKSVRVFLTSGQDFKAELVRVEEKSLILRANKFTRDWNRANQEAALPAAIVSKVRFAGKVGRKGLFGALAGLGAGGAIVAGVAAGNNNNCEGGSCGVVVAVVPVLAAAGYLLGHSMDKPAPAYVIEH